MQSSIKIVVLCSFVYSSKMTLRHSFVNKRVLVPWVFSAAIDKYIENYFIIIKCRGLPWPLGKEKTSES